ncbi:MAG TPA: phosphoglucosamine mutase [Rhodospirillaceae bacterium]|nr:MAG: phosphoglucosamine mutase [Alphaproteobacteria bacterium GWF2_58_20]HAU29049.1 phosphoglucosamine mutase [Rhodospirillaceae bacterium]
MSRLFGTDGVRGQANAEPMTAQTALKVALAAGGAFWHEERRSTVVIAKDTRLSGYMIEPALTAGFVSMGMDVVLVGPMPTPALAMLTRSLRADMGVMITASHNPYQDNGIKLFGADGKKISDDMQTRIERIVLGEEPFLPLAAPAKLGKARRLDDAHGRYIEFVKSTFPRDLRLDGLKVVIDCAHGAAYKIAPRVLWELGAEVVAIGVDPSGTNINQDCGATAPEAMRQRVLSEGASLGIALDGDADRLVMVDEKGQILDGDQILALIATSWQAEGRIVGGGVVATVMSNLGLERYLGKLGLSLVRTPVGDRHVASGMASGGFNVGGEQSGHIILSDYATTGDGLLAALQVLAVVQKAQKPMSEIAAAYVPLPQVMGNVRYPSRLAPLEDSVVKETIRKVENRFLETGGRILVRKSGTEPLIRVMAEGDDAHAVRIAVDEICAAIAACVGDGQ